MHGVAVWNLGIASRHFHAVRTQVAGAPFEQSQANGQVECLYQTRQITCKELVLQSLGRGRQQHALTTQQGRHQIGKGLADTCSSFDHQTATVCHHIGHSERHVSLTLARVEMVSGACQHTERCKGFLHQVAQGMCHRPGTGSGAAGSLVRSRNFFSTSARCCAASCCFCSYSPRLVPCSSCSICFCALASARSLLA